MQLLFSGWKESSLTYSTFCILVKVKFLNLVIWGGLVRFHAIQLKGQN